MKALLVIYFIIGFLIVIAQYCDDFARIYRVERLSGSSIWKAFWRTFSGETNFKTFAVDSGKYYEELRAGRLKSTDMYVERNNKGKHIYRLPDGREIPAYKQDI